MTCDMLVRPMIAIAVTAIGISAHAADIKAITARVVGVHDGDTITSLKDDKQQLKVRLHGIDAPELGQPFGQAAKPSKPAALGVHGI